MISAFSNLLVRRPLPGSCTQYCNHLHARTLATKARKQARASKPGKKKKKQTPPRKRGGGIVRARDGAETSTTSATPTLPLKDVSRAPHMRLESLPRRDGFKEYATKNPLLFAGFIIPTVITGTVVLIKPNLRAQVFGGGDDVGGVGGGKAGVNQSRETPVAAYGSEAKVASEEEPFVFVHEEEGGPSRGAADASAPAEGNPGGTVAEREGGATAVDLLSLVGFRPHPS